MADIDVKQLAGRMLRDYDERTPGTVFGEGLRLSLADAGRLQSAVAALREERGETVVGYKLGCVCAENQRANGITHPVSGRLWSTEQFESGATLSKADYANVAIEGEFAVTLARDVDPRDATIASIAKRVERVLPVIELHNLVMRGEPPRAPELIANNGIHAGVVRGTGMRAPRESQTTDLAVLFDGDVVDSWSSLSWPGDILQAVPWLVATLAERGARLSAGDTILTGAFGPPLPLGDKTSVEVVSSAFGSVTAAFA